MQQHWLDDLPIKDITAIEPILQGVANDVFKLTTAQAVYVLKHYRFDHPYGLNRDQEVLVQRQLASFALAPEVLYYDSEQGLLLQPFIDAPDLASSSLSMGTKTQRLAEVSAYIHRLQIDVPVWSLRSRLQGYCQALADYDVEQSRHFQELLQQQRKLMDGFGTHPIFCHNDLGFHHVFTSTPPMVIDWEYAGMGDRYFDLASTILTNDFDAQQQTTFINAYEAEAGFQVNQSILEQWMQLTTTINQLWYQLHQHLQVKSE